MANTFTAPFAQTPKTGVAINTAVSAVTGSTPANTVLICTAGANGALVTGISAIPRASAAATGLYLFLSKDSGSSKIVIDSELLAAITISAAVAADDTPFARISETTPLRLEAADRLYVGIGVALSAGITFKAEWTDF